MSNVIDFLERMGRDGQLRHASTEDMAGALEVARIDPQLAAAILARDSAQVESLLGDSKIYCALIPGKQDEEEEEEGEDDEVPSREDSEIPSQDLLHRVTSAR
jgi:hypothetical protein